MLISKFWATYANMRPHIRLVYMSFSIKSFVLIGVVNTIIIINETVIHVAYSIHDHDYFLARAQRQHPLALSSFSLIAVAANRTRTTTTSTGNSPLMRPPSLASPRAPMLLVPSMPLTKRLAGSLSAHLGSSVASYNIRIGINNSNQIVSWKCKLATQNHHRPPQARFLPRPSLLIRPRQTNLPTSSMHVLTCR
ncbi:hypothetical protein GALMADRAFT_917634 [Galerina marginata CBS 339.88]|uniref:Uncharacterized protein n=1 Tax=Galerina marginata (strain CBS 339.88) TaxID=685588 RepID=A0A067SS93_GALM3|nr:hypothetical protein GALMADRAFT_917634 [Galerina marginata CBS 339.88]